MSDQVTETAAPAITKLLAAGCAGDATAHEQLLPTVYPDLRLLARRELSSR